MIGLNQIYQEDCITFMGKLQEQKLFVDAIVTSPPYNINKEYSTYKDNKGENQYLEWLEDVAKASQSILKDDGSFFLNIGGRPAGHVLPFLVAQKFEETGYVFGLSKELGKVDFPLIVKLSTGYDVIPVNSSIESDKQLSKVIPINQHELKIMKLSFG